MPHWWQEKPETKRYLIKKPSGEFHSIKKRPVQQVEVFKEKGFVVRELDS